MATSQPPLPLNNFIAELGNKLLQDDDELWMNQELREIWVGSLQDHSIFKLKIGKFLKAGKDTKETAILLRGQNLQELLEDLGQSISDGEYLSIWESIHALEETALTAIHAEYMAAHAKPVSKRLVDELKRVPGAPEKASWTYLESKLEICLSAWPTRINEMDVNEARVDFLSLFLRNVLGSIAAPINVWQVLILKLEAALQPKDYTLQKSPLEPAFRLLWETLQTQTPLMYYNSICEELAEPEEETASMVAVLAICNAGPSKERAILLRGLSLAKMSDFTLSETFTSATASWRGALSQKLERSQSDIFTDAADQLVKLTEQAKEIRASIREFKKDCDQLGSSLAQGMQGNDISKQLSSAGQDLLLRSLWAATLTDNLVEGRELLIPAAIRELGLDPKATMWNKSSRMLAALQQIASEQNSALNWKEASQLLRALDQRLNAMKNRPIRWIERPKSATFILSNEVESGSQAVEKWLRLIEMSFQRLVVEERLSGRLASARMRRWTAETVFSDSLPISVEALVATYDAVLKDPKLIGVEESDVIEWDSLISAATAYAKQLPRVTASFRLSQNAQEIATQIAAEVVSSLPEYGETIGETGRESCVDDNRLTLMQIADLLLMDVDSPAELLTEWWAGVVGFYISNRPARLFETNLSCTYREMSRKLSNSETDIAFSILQEVYNETVGVSCIEALVGRPLPATGPLAHALQESETDVVLPEVELSSLQNAISNALTQNIPDQELLCSKLASCFLQFNQDCFTSGDADIAASIIMPALDTLSDSPFIEELCQALIRACAESPDLGAAAAFMLEESVDNFVMLLAQKRLGQLLQASAATVAKDYAEAMLAFAPSHFEHLDKADATALCVRDQTIINKKLGELLQYSSPKLFWLDATRYFLEILSPYISYPARIWALSFRTVAKRLGGQLNSIDNLYLARWVSQCEKLSAGWSSTHAIAAAVFDPNDYSFSARPDEDRPQRELLAAVITAEAVGASCPWPGSTLLERFLLSWSEGLKDITAIKAMVSNIKSVAGTHLNVRQVTLLESVAASLVKLQEASKQEGSAMMRLAQATNAPTYLELSAIYRLSNADEASIELYSTIRNTAKDNALPATLALTAVRTHLIHPLSADAPRALVSSFRPKIAAKLALRASAGFAGNVKQSDWQAWRDAMLGTMPSLNKFRSEITWLSMQWPSIEKAQPVVHCAQELAKDFLESISKDSDANYSADVALCDSKANAIAFEYVYRQSAYASFDPATSAPRLFFGTAAENHTKLPLTVAANAHVRTSLSIAKAMAGGGAGASQAAAEIEGDFFKLTGLAWKRLAFTQKPISDEVVSSFFKAIHPVAEDGANYAAKGNRELAKTLHTSLCLYLESIICALEESGDLQASWHQMLEAIHEDIDTIGGEHILSAFYGASINLHEHIGLNASVFWKYVLLEACTVVRQSMLGHCIMEHASEASKAYVESTYSGNVNQPIKCIRDQEHLLHSIAHCFCFQSPEIAWLNITTRFVETTLPHIPHSGTELAATWRWYESWFAQNTLSPMAITCLEWFGTMQDFSSRSVMLRTSSQTCFKKLSSHLYQKFGGFEWEWLHWVNAVAAASATSNTSIVTRSSMLERLMLSTEINNIISCEEWKTVAKEVENFLDAEAGGNVPNLLKRSIAQLPEIAARIENAIELGGVSLNRFLTANAGARASAPLARAFSFSRASLEDRTIRSDKADLDTYRALGIQLDDDDKLLNKLLALKATIGIAKTLKLEVAEQKTGFLAKLGLQKKEADTFNWMEDAGLRNEANYVVEMLALLALVGLEDAPMTWYLACPQVFKSISAETTNGSLKFYHALSQSLTNELGSDHYAAKALARFENKLSDATLAFQLEPTSISASASFALHLLDLRNAESIQAYFIRESPNEAIDSIQAKASERETKLKISEQEIENLRKTALVFKRSLA